MKNNKKTAKKADGGMQMPYAPNPYAWQMAPSPYSYPQPLPPDYSASGAYPQGMMPMDNNIQGNSAVQPYQNTPNFNQPSSENNMLGNDNSPTTRSPMMDKLGNAALEGFKTAGALSSGILNSIPFAAGLIPNTQAQRVDRIPKAVPPPIGNMYNTQMLFDGGGTIDNPIYTEANGKRIKSWKQGNIEVTQEMPSWYKPTPPSPTIPISNRDVSPLPRISPPNINMEDMRKKRVTYNNETLGNYWKRSDGGYDNRNYQQPVFHGNWNERDINSYMNALPQDGRYSNFSEITDMQGRNINYDTSYFEHGGNMSVGQEVDLTPEQIAHYKSLGYQFQ